MPAVPIMACCSSLSSRELSAVMLKSLTVASAPLVLLPLVLAPLSSEPLPDTPGAEPLADSDEAADALAPAAACQEHQPVSSSVS